MDMKIYFIMSCLILFAHGGPIIKHSIDNSKEFCGNQLSNTVSKYCALYFSPGASSNNENNDSNSRRGVVFECCKAKCTERFLVQNYCAEIKQEYKALFEKPAIADVASISNQIVADKSVQIQDDEAPNKIIKTVGNKKLFRGRNRCKQRNQKNNKQSRRNCRNVRGATNKSSSSINKRLPKKLTNRKRKCSCNKNKTKSSTKPKGKKERATHGKFVVHEADDEMMDDSTIIYTRTQSPLLELDEFLVDMTY